MFMKRISLLAGLCVLFVGCTTGGYKNGQEIDSSMYSYRGDTTAKQGVRYLFGRGVKQDDAKAFQYFSEAAGQGDKFAKNEVAYLYAAGKGTKQDLHAAFRWYYEAAKEGLASAQFNTGLMYLNGMGTPSNKKLAMQWVKKSAAQGFEPASRFMKQAKVNA